MAGKLAIWPKSSPNLNSCSIKNLPPWDFFIMTLASGKPNDDNFHCVGLCNGEWCDTSCSFELSPLCEGTENLKTKVTENLEYLGGILRCPIEKPGYFEVLGKCYYSDKIERNFDDSQANCKEIFPLGGKLFEPRDETTTAEVGKAYRKFNGNRQTWIGITDRSSQGIYQYETDNGNLTVSQWATSNPNRPSDDNHHCVALCNSSSDKWCDTSCSNNLYPLCEGNENENLKTKMNEISEYVGGILGCPIEKTGYFKVLGKCYFADKIERNFDNSQAHCKEVFPLGGQVFEPRDLKTNEEVGKAQTRYHMSVDVSNSGAWIGITDRIDQGSYKYASDNENLTISPWRSGEPNINTENCVNIYNSEWWDASCSNLKYSLCESTY